MSGSGTKNRPNHRDTTRAARNKALACTVLLVAWAGSTHAQDMSALALKLSSPNVEERRDALYSLRQIASAEAGRLAIKTLADDKDVVRATAASVVVFAPPSESVPALTTRLNDKSQFVRREIAYALGKTRDGAAVSPITERLAKEKDHEVQAALVAALGEIGSPAGINALVGVLGKKIKEDEEFVRRSAALSIGRIAQTVRTGSSDTSFPQSFLPDKFKDDLADHKPVNLAYFREAGEVLIKILKDAREAPDTKREAAYALGAIGNPAYANSLEPLTRSDDPYLGEIAREALKRLASPID